MTADNTGAKPHPQPSPELSPLERLEQLDHLETQQRLRQAQSEAEGPPTGEGESHHRDPTGFQGATTIAAALFALLFITHAIMAGIDIAKALDTIGGRGASSLQDDLVQQARLRVGIGEARDACFLLLGWLAAVWLGRNSALVQKSD